MSLLDVDITVTKNKNGMSLKNLKKYFLTLHATDITVGIHADAGKDNVNKMKWNEFGTNHKLKYDSVAIQNVGLKPLSSNTAQFVVEDFSNLVEKGVDISIPARPVVRMYLYPEILREINIEQQLAINRAKKEGLKNPQASAEKTQRKVGEECVMLQREKMAKGNFAPIDNKGKDQNNNSPLTQYIKGFNHPYFKTGELISKINYKIK